MFEVQGLGFRVCCLRAKIWRWEWEFKDLRLHGFSTGSYGLLDYILCFVGLQRDFVGRHRMPDPDYALASNIAT